MPSRSLPHWFCVWHHTAVRAPEVVCREACLGVHQIHSCPACVKGNWHWQLCMVVTGRMRDMSTLEASTPPQLTSTTRPRNMRVPLGGLLAKSLRLPVAADADEPRCDLIAQWATALMSARSPRLMIVRRGSSKPREVPIRTRREARRGLVPFASCPGLPSADAGRRRARCSSRSTCG